MADHLDTLEVSANYKAYCLSASLPSYYESFLSCGNAGQWSLCKA